MKIGSEMGHGYVAGQLLIVAVISYAFIEDDNEHCEFTTSGEELTTAGEMLIFISFSPNGYARVLRAGKIVEVAVVCLTQI